MSRAVSFHFPIAGTVKKGCGGGGRADMCQLETAYGNYSQHHKS